MAIKPQPIWYSNLSTGIFEVDLQHSNIDQLIVLLERTKGEGRINESIDVLIHAIEDHFKYEERRFANNSKKMNQTHINEHRRILKKYCDLANIVHVSNTEKIKNDIVKMLKIVLMNHVKHFDCKFFQNAR
jgi:hemerythrin-like metal-binding protein